MYDQMLAGLRRIGLRRLGIISITSAFVVVCCGAVTLFVTYSWDRNQVHSVLAATPGVQSVEVVGYEDGLAWKVVGATVRLDGADGRTIELAAPRVEELSTGAHVALARIGPYTFNAGYDDHRSCAYLDLGTAGIYADIFPCHISSFEDVVKNYDTIISSLNKMRPSGIYSARNGKRYMYSIEKDAPTTRGAS